MNSPSSRPYCYGHFLTEGIDEERDCAACSYEDGCWRETAKTRYSGQERRREVVKIPVEHRNEILIASYLFGLVAGFIVALLLK